MFKSMHTITAGTVSIFDDEIGVIEVAIDKTIPCGVYSLEAFEALYNTYKDKNLTKNIYLYYKWMSHHFLISNINRWLNYPCKDNLIKCHMLAFCDKNKLTAPLPYYNCVIRDLKNKLNLELK